MQFKYPTQHSEFRTQMGNAILILSGTIKEMRKRHLFFTHEDLNSFIKFLAEQRKKIEIKNKNPFAELYGLAVPTTISEILSFNQRLHDFAEKNKHLTQYNGSTFFVPTSQLKVTLISKENLGIDSLTFTDILSKNGRHNKFYAEALLFIADSRNLIKNHVTLDLPGGTLSWPTLTMGIIDPKNILEIDTVLVMHPPVKARILENKHINKIILDVLNNNNHYPQEDFEQLARYFFLNSQLPPFVLGTPSITEALVDTILRAKYDIAFPAPKIDEPFWRAIFWTHKKPFSMNDWLDCYN